MNVSPCIILIYIYICVGLPRECISTPILPNEPHVDINATVRTQAEGAQQAQDIDDVLLLLKPGEKMTFIVDVNSLRGF